MPLLWRSSRESRSERCKRAFLLAPICKVLLAPTLVSDRANDLTPYTLRLTPILLLSS
jgi:hypothetical protein